MERFHQTLKKWLAQQPRAATLRQLQHQLDTFRTYYNEVRPHRAIGRRAPAQAYAARPKALPTGCPAARRALAHPTRPDRQLRRVPLRYNSKLHHVGIGRQHAGTDILVLVHDLDIRVLASDGALIRELVLHPSRDYQSQPQK